MNKGKIMVPGDLVKHRFKGRDTDTGIVVRCYNKPPPLPGRMIEVMWDPMSSLKDNWLYSSSHLEIINESR